MNKKQIYIFVITLLTCSGTSLYAEPLPPGTVLSIDIGNANTAGYDAADVCTVGSCMGAMNSGTPDFWFWGNLSSGTDGGLVIGKNQVSGGQEQLASIDNMTSGEMTEAFYFFGSHGTFFTETGSENVFDDASCIDAACDLRVILNSFDLAWSGDVLSLGDPKFWLDSINWQVNPDGSYLLDVTKSYQTGQFTTVSIRVILRGFIQPGTFVPPKAGAISIDNVSGLLTEWIPDVSGAAGYPKVCAIETQPANGVATVDAGCTFGTYESNSGFVGVDNFNYSVASGFVSDTASVTANVSDAACESYPIQMATTTGGGQSQSINDALTTTFVGRLTTQQGLTSGAKNKITVCPGSKVSFESLASVGEASCSINGAVTGSSGVLFSGDKLICTNKPDGNDVDRFSVKNGL